MTSNKTSFYYAFNKTIPIMLGFIFLGMTYGIFMQQKGFNFLYPTLMALFIFGGSVEFLIASLMLQDFNPINIMMITLIINSRHIFYGISMLEKYKGTGWKKCYLIFGLCDESFSINYTTTLPKAIDPHSFMFYVTLLNHIYWVLGACLGGILGSLIQINLKGMSFVMTALFITLLVDQLIKEKDHLSSSLGLSVTLIMLFLFKGNTFLILSLITITLIFFIIDWIKNNDTH